LFAETGSLLPELTNAVFWMTVPAALSARAVIRTVQTPSTGRLARVQVTTPVCSASGAVQLPPPASIARKRVSAGSTSLTVRR
jgi:hypothetical protein